MSVIGTVESLWRYPVKSMRGEELDEIFAGYAGVFGDRLFAFASSASPPGFPFLTARELRHMVSYRPRFRDPLRAARPINQVEAQALSPMINPISASPADRMVEVATPDGRALAIDDPALLEMLRAGLEGRPGLTLLRSDKAMTDCRPLSLFAVQTAAALSEEAGRVVDKRRFRANVYLDLAPADGFAEDQFVGHTLRIGPTVVVAVLARDTRCMMIVLDPETGKKTPAILKHLARTHENKAGVYGAVLTEGMIRKGDSVELLS